MHVIYPMYVGIEFKVIGYMHTICPMYVGIEFRMIDIMEGATEIEVLVIMEIKMEMNV